MGGGLAIRCLQYQKPFASLLMPDDGTAEDSGARHDHVQA